MITRKERRLPQCVLTGDMEVLYAVKQEVHPRDARGGQHSLLTVELAPQGLRVTAGPLYMLNDLDKHATGSACRVVDGLALLGVEDVHQ